MHIAPRDTFPQPPLGMEIDYDAGATIMVRCDNPEQHLVVQHCERRHYFKGGRSAFRWCGVSCYPRVKALTVRAPGGANTSSRLSRSTKQNKDSTSACPPSVPVLVEACCEEGSLLSKRTRWSRTRSVFGITEELDFIS